MALPSGYTGNDDHSKKLHMVVTIFCAHLRNFVCFAFATNICCVTNKNALLCKLKVKKGAKQFAIPFLQSTH